MDIDHFRGGPSWCFRFMRRRNLFTRSKTTVAPRLPADYPERAAISAPSHIPNMDDIPLTFDIPLTHKVEKKGTSTVAIRTTEDEKRNRSLCPKFLHTNSTSHTWPFSAIAELIDNAYDPDVNASHFWIDKTVIQGHDCLILRDNGNGLTHESMHKMLSFGYSDKTTLKGKEPIGIYGNGFKSGSMRLGSDAIVFSKSRNARCVGLLSQTYLEKIKAEQIIVPIVCFEGGNNNNPCVKERDKASLQDILQYSPFRTLKELLLEVDAISSPPLGKTGTRIIIWNLRRTSSDTTEFDFEKDPYDIQIPLDESDTRQGKAKAVSCVPESFRSLRAYCSILYLKPRMQIIIRGEKVKNQLIAKSLAFIRKDHYKPNFLDRRIPITFGYNTKSKDQYGVMMYHKNRLIKAYTRVGCQLKANTEGVGVIGVIECNFLDPTHNKQSFDETDKYHKTITSLGIKLEEYWKEIRHMRKQEDPKSIPAEDAVKRPDQNWVQCDECLKWRKLPDGIDCDKLPNKWFCLMNPDPQFRSCHVEEEPEDTDAEQPTYRKTFKQQERQEKKTKEINRQKEEEEQKHREQQRLTDLTRQNRALKRQLRQNPTRSRSAHVAPETGATGSQAACSSSNNDGLPVIANVFSLSSGLPGGERPQPRILQETPKRQKYDHLFVSISEAATPMDESPASSPSLLENISSDPADDLAISESPVNPKPQKPSVELITHKMETDQSSMDMLPEFGDRGTRLDTTEEPVTMCKTIQTEEFKVKKEEPQSQIEGESSRIQVDNWRNTFWVKQPTEKKIQDGTKGANPATLRLQRGVTHPLEAINHVNGSLNDAEDNQEQLQAPTETAAQERDALKEQVRMLTVQLQETQDRLEELMETTVKKECSHQFSQTEDTTDYKHLFSTVKQKIDELTKDSRLLLPTTEAEPRAVPGEEKDVSKIIQPVELLVKELEQRNKERDELCSQLDVVEKERTKLVKQCEEQNLVLQQREKPPEDALLHGTTGPTIQNYSGNVEATAYKSLISLRQNVGRLLVTTMPALDLDQVNYECNVIDEILDQVLMNP
ncbi:MORC family CW-type zinc finger protein 3a isoform X2 [Takifugu rubripes]|uniref:MORC family CW-type zinc finger protein 3a isoform X2 n=1 Tax=Takifugu rubripes TaxID=31033 RepID=UPI00114533CD|nr:MORC family CW-type zinc finger protein 3 isoform X2 [Takifugu rubripes]